MQEQARSRESRIPPSAGFAEHLSLQPVCGMLSAQTRKAETWRAAGRAHGMKAVCHSVMLANPA